MRLALLLLLVAPAAAIAQTRSIPWTTDYYHAREEAKDRGVPILLCIGAEGDLAPERMLEGAWRSEGIAELMSNAVCVLAWKGSPHSRLPQWEHAVSLTLGQKRTPVYRWPEDAPPNGPAVEVYRLTFEEANPDKVPPPPPPKRKKDAPKQE